MMKDYECARVNCRRISADQYSRKTCLRRLTMSVANYLHRDCGNLATFVHLHCPSGKTWLCGSSSRLSRSVLTVTDVWLVLVVHVRSPAPRPPALWRENQSQGGPSPSSKGTGFDAQCPQCTRKHL